MRLVTLHQKSCLLEVGGDVGAEDRQQQCRKDQHAEITLQLRRDHLPPLRIEDDQTYRWKQVGQDQGFEARGGGDHAGGDCQGHHRLHRTGSAIRPAELCEHSGETEGEQSSDRHLVHPMRDGVLEVCKPSDDEKVHRAEDVEEGGVEDHRPHVNPAAR
jgi:hypothetical protein